MQTTATISIASPSKLRRNCAVFLMLANLALAAALLPMFSSPQAITSPLALIAALGWICAISIGSATVIVIAGCREISRGHLTHLVIEPGSLTDTDMDLLRGLMDSTRRESSIVIH